jgi:hypothetical protein
MLFEDDLQLLSDAPEAQLSLGRPCLSYFKGFNNLRALMIRVTAWVANGHHCKPELFSVLSVENSGPTFCLCRLQSLLGIWQLSRQSWNFMMLFMRPKSSLLCCKYLLRDPIWSQLNLVYTPHCSTSLLSVLILSSHIRLGHCARNRHIVGSIPDGVMEIFHLFNPFCRKMALGSTQALKEMSTRSISWAVKGTGA